MYKIFVYGTLLNRDTLHSLVGRSVTTYSDSLGNYTKVGLNIVPMEDSKVDGAWFEVDAKELKSLDSYEGTDIKLYKREILELDSGEKAWVYTKCDPDSKIYISGTDTVG